MMIRGISIFGLLLALLGWFPPVAAQMADEPIVVNFPAGSAEVDEAGMRLLEELGAAMQGWSVTRVLVEGFADPTPPAAGGGYRDNIALSQARADRVTSFLREKSGAPPALFASVGRGMLRPLEPNDTPQGRAANRRAEIRVFRHDAPPRITMTFRDVPVSEACEMLARRGRVNIVLGKEVNAAVSINLYDVTLEEAVYAVADAAGLAVKSRHGGFLLLTAEEAGRQIVLPADTRIRAFKIQYSDPEEVEKIISKHLSRYGKSTVLEQRRLLVVEDVDDHMRRIETVLQEIDRVPWLIQIEAQILEIQLDNSETFGLDWAALFSADGGSGTVGMQGFASPDATGFIARLTDADNLTFIFNALNKKGKVHTLSTPKLLALENQEASVIIGDRQGYKVTTTINQVTTESIEFLESGIILKVTPSVDRQERILMKIHPEVSTGTIKDGIPAQTTTEVETHLLAGDGQPIFIGGLIKKQGSYTRSGMPLLGDLPGVGRLFSSTEETSVNTETVVVITPHIVREGSGTLSRGAAERVEDMDARLERLLEFNRAAIPLAGGAR